MKLKQLSISRKSLAVLQSVEATWMLKSQRSRMEDDTEKYLVRNSHRSEKKAVLSLAG